MFRTRLARIGEARSAFASIVCLASLTASAAAHAQVPPNGSAEGAKRSATVALERALQDAVRQHPDRFDAHHHLGEFYLRQGRLTRAIACLERARTLDPSHYTNGFDLAVAYIQTGRLADARRQIEGWLAQGNRGELQNLLGDLEEKGGSLQAAAEAYQRAAEMDPTEEHLFDFGNSLLQLHAYEPAAQIFAHGIARHPDAARLRVGLGIAQYSLGQYDDAVRALCAAADLDPTDPRPHLFLGEMYGVSVDLAAEITSRLARFLQRNPSHAKAHYYYALALWKGKWGADPAIDFGLIEKLLTRAVKLDPRLSAAHFQLGGLFSQQTRYPEAIRALRTAVALQPDMAEAHYRLAGAYQRTGQKTLADREMAVFKQLKAREK
jgi:tetratricopeptide (TPR) repeat protein